MAAPTLPNIWPSWLSNKGLRKLNFLFFFIYLTSTYEGFDNSMMSGLQILPTWHRDMKYPSAALIGLLNSIQNVGAVLSLPFVPILCDRYGRRKTILFGAVITIIGAVLQGTSHHVGQFIAARFFIGVGLAFSIVASPLLLVELALPKQRGSVMALFPTAYYTGSITAAWIVYGTQNIVNSWGWRIPSLLQAGPAALQILAILFVPESPRWLISQMRDSEAKRLIAKYHANGNEQDPTVELEYEEIKLAINVEAEQKRVGKWRSLISTPANRRRMTIVVLAGIFIEISGTGLLSLYIHQVLDTIGITDTRTQTILNGCISIYKFVISVVASLFVERAGRRPLFIASTAGMLVSFIIWTVCSALYAQNYSPGSSAVGVLVAIFLVNGFYCIGWTPLWSYPSELMSFETRSKGVTVLTGVLHISSFFATFVNPIGISNSGWRYFIAYVIYTALELIAVWYFFVETRGYTLEEIDIIFETPGLSWKQRRNMRGTGQYHEQSELLASVFRPAHEKSQKVSIEGVKSGPEITNVSVEEPAL